jgi:hypothetical protein
MNSRRSIRFQEQDGCRDSGTEAEGRHRGKTLRETQMPVGLGLQETQG